MTAEGWNPWRTRVLVELSEVRGVLDARPGTPQPAPERRLDDGGFVDGREDVLQGAGNGVGGDAEPGEVAPDPKAAAALHESLGSCRCRRDPEVVDRARAAESRDGFVDGAGLEGLPGQALADLRLGQLSPGEQAQGVGVRVRHRA